MINNEEMKIGFDSLQRIKFEQFEKDFSFIVNGEIYQTSSAVACILSPRISKCFEENMSISSYSINITDKGDFNQIIQYGEMKAINIKEEIKPYFENIMKKLGNSNEFCRFSKEFTGGISYENVFQRIKSKQELDIDFDEEVLFISSNFHDFYTKYHNAIFALDVDIIEQIISNKNLKINDEDELFDIVHNLYMKSKEYSLLFSHVLFMNLSIESIRKFNENFDINYINRSIWQSICHRLEQNVSKESKKAYQESHQEFLNNRYIIQQKQTNKRQEKIIQHLCEKFPANDHLQNIIDITSSSEYSSAHSPRYIVDPNVNVYFCSKNESNSYIRFDFKERKLLLDSYTLTSHNDSQNDHLKNWILKVSNDGVNYTEIDRHINCDLLNGKLKTATFNVSCPTPQRYILLQQTDTNWANTNYLTINKLEFSGILYE